jgi:hypothetical protein
MRLHRFIGHDPLRCQPGAFTRCFPFAIVALACVDTTILDTRPESPLELKLRYAHGHALQRRLYPACCQDPDIATLAAHQSTTSHGFPLPFLSIQTTDKTEASCDATSRVRVDLGVDLGPNLQQRTQFRIFCDSITMCSPHALPFTLSQLLPLHTPCIDSEHDRVFMKEQG